MPIQQSKEAGRRELFKSLYTPQGRKEFKIAMTLVGTGIALIGAAIVGLTIYAERLGQLLPR